MTEKEKLEARIATYQSDLNQALESGDETLRDYIFYLREQISALTHQLEIWE